MHLVILHTTGALQLCLSSTYCKPGMSYQNLHWLYYLLPWTGQWCSGNLVFISFQPQTCQTSLERLFLCLCFSRNDSALKLLDPRGDTSFKSYECNSSNAFNAELAGISAHHYGMLKMLVHYLSSLCMVMASVLFSSSIIRHPEGWMGNVLDPEGRCWLWLPYWSWCWWAANWDGRTVWCCWVKGCWELFCVE